MYADVVCLANKYNIVTVIDAYKSLNTVLDVGFTGLKVNREELYNLGASPVTSEEVGILEVVVALMSKYNIKWIAITDGPNRTSFCVTYINLQHT